MDTEPLQKKLHQYYDQLAGGLCLLRQDRDEQILFVNSEILALYQCANEEEFYYMTGGKFSGMMNREDYVPLRTRMNSRHGDQSSSYAYLTFRYYTRKGQSRYVEGCCREAEFPEIGKVWLVNILNREGRESDGELDSVTGLLNMHAFYQRIQELAGGSAGPYPAYASVYLNLTNFKLFNEMHGIYEGDRLLKSIAGLLKTEFSSSCLSRLSGDNFALFVPRAGLKAKIEDLCHKADRLIHNPSIVMKAGVYLLTGQEEALSSLASTSFDMAKLACDSIKRDATRCCAVYHEDMRREVMDRAYIIDNLDRAIRDGHIKVYLQPVVRALTGELCGYEALARWESPGRGVFSPGLFIPVLEDTRLIYKLDTYMLQEVGRLLRYQLQNNLPMVPVSVNLSRYDFLLMDPLSVVEEVVARFHIPRYYLRLEVTESALVQEHDVLVKKLRQFREAGYQVWLDDFGSAYSSLNVLQNYEFDELKIDQGLLRYFNEESRKIIRSIVLMAKTMGTHVLAEGAETKEHVDFLRSIGCEKIQGYFYGRPMPYELLHEHHKETAWPIESLSEEQAYDAAGLVNLITDAPVAIIQYRDDGAQIISANEAYQHTLKVTGTQSLAEFNANMCDTQYPMREKFLSFLASAVHSERESRMTFVENGQYMRLSAHKLAETPSFALLQAQLTNLTYDQDLTTFHRYENVFRNLMLIYDDIYFIDHQNKEVHVIESMTSLWQAGDTIEGLQAMADAYARHYIYAEDRTRFHQFLTPDAIYRQAEQSGRSEAIEMFRVQKANGRFVWMIFDAIVIYKSACKDILLCVRENIWERQANLYALLPQFLPYLDGAQTRQSSVEEEAALWRAICNVSPLPLYWKDRELRYRGVSPAFLDCTGLRDASEVIGKTDDELGWCLEDEVETRAEREAIEKGMVYADYICTCVLHGVTQRITITSFPIHQSGQITGVLGYFHFNNEAAEKQEQERLGILDRATGLLGFRGMIMAGMNLEEDRIQRGEDYLGIILQVPEVKVLAQQYSPEVQQQILATICEHLDEGGPLAQISSYIGSGVFICFCKTRYLKDPVGQIQQLKKNIESITSVAGFSCTLTLNYTMIRGSEAKGFNTMLYLLATRLHEATCQRWNFERPSEGGVMLDLTQLSTLEDAVSIIAVDTYDLLYCNSAFLRLLHLPDSPNSYRGKKCYELLARNAAPCATCDNHRLQRGCFCTRLRSDHFSQADILQRDTLVIYQGQTARFSLITDLQAYHLTGDDDRKTLLHREEVINDIITTGIQEKNPEEGIHKIIARIGETLQAERVLIFEENGDGTVSNTYEWRRDTAESIMMDLQNIPMERIQPLYDHFAQSPMLILNDIAPFLQVHPGFTPVLHGLTSIVSGHLTESGRSIGFTEVINPASETFASADFLLNSLTSVAAIMLRNRDMLRRLELYSYRDQLTGVGNRRALLSFIRTIPDGTSLAFFFGDINGLKVENDTKGHEAGDLLIKKAATVLVAAAGPERVFRMGGDEFLLIVENITKQEADAMLKELRATYARQHISVAIGCTVQVSPLRSIDTILSEADALMYENKRQMHAHHKES